MEPSQTNKAQLAGTVLAVMGLFTYGATSAFGAVLSIEWLLAPRPQRKYRTEDWIGCLFGFPGAIFFVYFTFAMFDYSPGGNSFAPMLSLYWAGFVFFLLVRNRVRWPEIRKVRQAHFKKEEEGSNASTELN